MAGMLRDVDTEAGEDSYNNSDVISEHLGSQMSEKLEENNLLNLYSIIEEDDVPRAVELLKIC